MNEWKNEWTIWKLQVKQQYDILWYAEGIVQ